MCHIGELTDEQQVTLFSLPQQAQQDFEQFLEREISTTTRRKRERVREAFEAMLKRLSVESPIRRAVP